MRSTSLRTRRSLLDLDDLTAEELSYIFERAAALMRGRLPQALKGVTCVNMFFEPSTRTYASFNLAEMRLGADIVNLSPDDLSLTHKGESIEDTAITLSAMGVDILVLRHPDIGFPARVAMVFDGHVINAGDGCGAHPTQALLDIYTLLDEFGDLRGRTIAIVGDVLHSRVANSTIRGLHRLGASVVLVGPEALLPQDLHDGAVTVERNFDAVLPAVDALILLRIQHERFAEMPLGMKDYVEGYCLSERRLQKLRGDAIVMHPGPYNRGVELDECVLEYTGWRYAKQVMHGVPVRMAVLDLLINGFA